MGKWCVIAVFLVAWPSWAGASCPGGGALIEGGLCIVDNCEAQWDCVSDERCERVGICVDEGLIYAGDGCSDGVPCARGTCQQQYVCVPEEQASALSGCTSGCATTGMVVPALVWLPALLFGWRRRPYLAGEGAARSSSETGSRLQAQ